jgi:hypothetical protein
VVKLWVWVKELWRSRSYNVLAKTSLLEPGMLQGWRDDVKAVQEGRLRHDVAQEPYFPLVQLEMLRLQVVEARSLTRATKTLVFATVGTCGSYHHLGPAYFIIPSV